MRFLAQTAPDALPAWLTTAAMVPFLTGLWWTERKARERAEDRERTVLTESAEKVYVAIDALSRATQVVDAYARKG